MLQLRGQPLSLAEIARVALERERVEIAPEAHARSSLLAAWLSRSSRAVKSFTELRTGFGKLSDVNIPPDKLEQLQVNLVRSHSCGVGRPLSEPEVRAMMLLRANVLTLGFSGIRLEVIELWWKC